jgi:DNA-binding MarR family transcriptional regulator
MKRPKTEEERTRHQAAKAERTAIQEEVLKLAERAHAAGLKKTKDALIRVRRHIMEYPDFSPPVDPLKVNLTANERKVLERLADHQEYGFPFAALAADTGIPPHLIKRPVRSLARKGLAMVERLFCEDDGLTRGSGYMVTEAGMNRWRQDATK